MNDHNKRDLFGLLWDHIRITTGVLVRLCLSPTKVHRRRVTSDSLEIVEIKVDNKAMIHPRPTK